MQFRKPNDEKNEIELIEKKEEEKLSNVYPVPSLQSLTSQSWLEMKEEEIKSAKNPYEKEKSIAVYEWNLGIFSKLNKEKKIREARQAELQKLMDAIVAHADPFVVKEILKKDPTLLLEKGSAQHPAGPWVRNVEPYRAALCMHDDEMAKILQEALTDLAGEDVAHEQYNAQFPHGFEQALKDAETRWKPVTNKAISLMKVLVEVEAKGEANAVTEGGQPRYILTINDATIAQLEKEFQEAMQAVINTPTSTGLYYSPDAFIKIGQFYDDHRQAMGDWDDPKAMLAARYLVGGMQDKWPVNIAQAGCGGFYNEVEKRKRGESQHRDLSFDNWVNDRRQKFWQKSMGVNDFVLGRDLIFYRLGGAWAVCGVPRYLSNLMSIKNKCITRLARNRDSNPEKTSRCLMM